MASEQEILEATERLIRRKGVARVTTKEIAREAGCSEGSVFNHFATKDELLLAAVFERLPRFRIALPEAGSGEVSAGLTPIVNAALRFFESVLPVAVAVFADASLLAKHREAMQGRKGGPHHMARTIAGYIEAEQRLGRVDPEAQPLSLAVQLLGTCFFWVFIQSTNGMPLLPGVSEEQFTADLVASLWRGMKPVSSR
jgi:AcrR family transcriptional regulator